MDAKWSFEKRNVSRARTPKYTFFDMLVKITIEFKYNSESSKT
jgi:hypothetical protein